jgi:hypothetical protein
MEKMNKIINYILKINYILNIIILIGIIDLIVCERLK